MYYMELSDYKVKEYIINKKTAFLIFKKLEIVLGQALKFLA